jgi:hypothetical protein
MASYETYGEYLKSPTFKAIRQVAMNRERHTCKCGALATQVHHHNGYPPWNSWDLPSALEPICYECHCKEHGKPT